MSLFAQPNYVEIEYTADEKGIPQLTTCRVNVTELSPRSFNINLLKKPPQERERLVKLFQRYAGEPNPATKSPVMVNGREGQTDSGIVFLLCLMHRLFRLAWIMRLSNKRFSTV